MWRVVGFLWTVFATSSVSTLIPKCLWKAIVLHILKVHCIVCKSERTSWQISSLFLFWRPSCCMRLKAKNIIPSFRSKPQLTHLGSLIPLPQNWGRGLTWDIFDRESGSGLVAQSCPTVCDPMDCSSPGSSVHGISQAIIRSGLPFPSPGDLPDPGMEPRSPALRADSSLTEPPGKPRDKVGD